MNSAIRSVEAIQILNSRGNPTLLVRAELENGTEGWAEVPSGASAGELESIELRDGDVRCYRGKGVLRAAANITGPICQALAGEDALNQAHIDAILVELDGTGNRSRLGANAITGVSLAVAKAAAKSEKLELFEYLGSQSNFVLPMPHVTMIDGGAHANNGLDLQGFLIVPVSSPSFHDAVRMCVETYHALGGLLRDDGYETSVGDAGGYAPRFETASLAFDYVLKAVERAGYKPGEDLAISLEIAASEFAEYDNDSVSYQFAQTGSSISSAQLLELYHDWTSRYPIVSIEDAFGERDWTGWKCATAELGAEVQLLGDDIFVTNPQLLARGIEERVANAVAIKVNQIATVTGAFETRALAREAHYAAVMEHRSGDTGDTAVADLAVAFDTNQIKVGAPCRGERTEKYNRLLWIEHLLGQKAHFENPFSSRLPQQ